MDPEILEQFKDLDVNGDGFLTLEEMKTGFEKYGQNWGEADEERFKKMDENGDGKIGLEGMKNLNFRALLITLQKIRTEGRRFIIIDRD